jgi:hypothetical protein
VCWKKRQAGRGEWGSEHRMAGKASEDSGKREEISKKEES